jgi:hypothetical protein
VKRFFIPNKSNGFQPYLLRKSALVVYTLLLLLVNTIGGMLGIPEVRASSITSANIIQLTNQERASLGLNTLRSNSKLSAAALAKANNMFQEQYWDHFGPNGETPWQFISQAGYSYVYAGENLAKGFRTAEGVHEAWMASPTHKENIVSRNYQDIGVAVVEGVLLGKETILVVQMFGNLTENVSKVPEVKSNSETKVPPKTTAPVKESGQIKSIKIISPKDGVVIDDANVDIEGETVNITGEYQVEIRDGESVVGELSSKSSKWSFDKGSDWEEGQHDITAKVKGTDIQSNKVNMTIDTTAPVIEKESVSVQHMDDLFKVIFQISGDHEDVKLISGDRNYPVDKSTDGGFAVTILKSDLGERTVLMASDKIGNISELDISEYFIEGDSEEVSTNLILNLRNIFGSTDGISLAILSFVFVLLVIQVYIYWKKNSLGKHSGDLFSLGAWWIVLIVALFKGFGGIIN